MHFLRKALILTFCSFIILLRFSIDNCFYFYYTCLIVILNKYNPGIVCRQEISFKKLKFARK